MIKLSREYWFLLVVVICLAACGEKDSPDPPPAPVVKTPVFSSASVNTISLDNLVYDVNLQPVIKIVFSEPLRPEKALNMGINITQKFENENVSGYISNTNIIATI